MSSRSPCRCAKTMPVVSVTTGLDIEGAGGKRAVAPGGPLALPRGGRHPLDGRPRCMVATSHASGTVGSSGFSGSHFGERTGVSLPLRGRTGHRHRQQCFVDARAQGHGSLPPGPASRMSASRRGRHLDALVSGCKQDVLASAQATRQPPVQTAPASACVWVFSGSDHAFRAGLCAPGHGGGRRPRPPDPRDRG